MDTDYNMSALSRNSALVCFLLCAKYSHVCFSLAQIQTSYTVCKKHLNAKMNFAKTIKMGLGLHCLYNTEVIRLSLILLLNTGVNEIFCIN